MSPEDMRPGPIMSDQFWLEARDLEVAELQLVISHLRQLLSSSLPDDMVRRAALEYLNAYGPLEDQ